MYLFPIHEDRLALVADWLGNPENFKWLHFGQGVQQLSGVSLKVMLAKKMHELRLFGENPEKPAGVVALSDINKEFGSATLWYVLGDKSQSGKGFTTRAAKRMIAEGFDSLELESIYAWAVEENKPSVKVLTNCGFKYIGRRRKGHRIDGEYKDVLLFDLLAEETQPLTRFDEYVAHK